jgi:hypothetical protein
MMNILWRRPTMLYHVTRKDRVPKIRRQGLRPHVPGKVWGVCDPEATRGKPVVWLTANPHQWRHHKHRDRALRDPDCVMLTIMIDWSAPKLRHYLSWIDPRKNQQMAGPNNPMAWFVYFGAINPAQIVGGLERPRRKISKRHRR